MQSPGNLFPLEDDRSRVPSFTFWNARDPARLFQSGHISGLAFRPGEGEPGPQH
jgi:hypothetical protein